MEPYRIQNFRAPIFSMTNRTNSGAQTAPAPVAETPAADTAAATPRELLGLTPAKPLFPVGSAHRYSNTGYILLGLALEKAALGASFNEADADAVTLMLVRLNTGDLTPTDTPTDQEHP